MAMDRKELKRRMILEAAAQVFANKGFKNATTAEIAQAAGIGKSTIYEYFRNKDALLADVLNWFAGKMGADSFNQVREMPGSAQERLVYLVEHFSTSLAQAEDIYGLFMEFWALASQDGREGAISRMFVDSYSQWRQTIADLIQDGIDQGEFRPDCQPMAVASGLIAALDGLGLQAWFDQSVDTQSMGSHFVEMLLSGVLAPSHKGE